MDTLVSVLKNVEALGYTGQFRVVGDLLHTDSGADFTSKEVSVDHFYRFEGESSQDDEAILYAISTVSGEKGTLVDGYGASGDEVVSAFMRQVTDVSK